MNIVHSFKFTVKLNGVHPRPVNIRQKATPSSAIDGVNAMLVGVGVRGAHWPSGEREREWKGWGGGISIFEIQNELSTPNSVLEKLSILINQTE